MRTRAATVLLATLAALAASGAAMSPATACDPEQCPPSCTLLEQVFSRPVCDGIDWSIAIR